MIVAPVAYWCEAGVAGQSQEFFGGGVERNLRAIVNYHGSASYFPVHHPARHAG